MWLSRSIIKLILAVGLLPVVSAFGAVQACTLFPLPQGLSNHAVAWTYADGAGCGAGIKKTKILVAGGLRGGKTWRHVSKKVFLHEDDGKGWKIMPDLPMKERGVLAATAVSVKGKFYIMGGYTVAPDGAEKSTPYVFYFNDKTKKYRRMANMPVPVDDTVSFTYQDRYIYLVSGWHDTDNVQHVQVYDTLKNTWSMATPFPGKAVFGHAGGIVGNRFIIADGVGVFGLSDSGRRQYRTVNQQWMGTIDADNPRLITWQRLPKLPGKGNYRMAAVGDAAQDRIIFTGGTSNAYNYSGIGYNGVPSQPTAHTWAWDFKSGQWQVLKNWSEATMDHRGLVMAYGRWYTVGGMGRDQKLLKRAIPWSWDVKQKKQEK